MISGPEFHAPVLEKGSPNAELPPEPEINSGMSHQRMQGRAFLDLHPLDFRNYLNLKFALWTVPSVSLTCSCLP
jgi:hypothetical protein